MRKNNLRKAFILLLVAIDVVICVKWSMVPACGYWADKIMYFIMMLFVSGWVGALISDGVE